MKKTLIIGLFLTLIVPLGMGKMPNQPPKIYIPIITKSIESNFWKGVKEGAEEAANEYNIEITFQGTPRGAEAEEQLKILREVLAKQPAAIILSALDSQAATPYLEEAEAAGIPVIGFDSGVDSPIVRTTVATDNYEAGALTAEKMAEFIGGAGKVGIITLDRTSKVGSDRADGFVDTLTQKYSGIEVLPVEYNEGGVESSMQIAERMLTENPDIKGIFGANEDSTIGIVQAVEKTGKQDQVAIIGFDSARVADAVRAGKIKGAITQNPREIGYRAVETAYEAYQGRRTPEFINTGFRWYDKTNIDDPDIQHLLYE
ncbi:MAG: family transporter substrate-binding protein [Clostridia bacterium]|nr:family transporter substrate-binding protein [Clostridia bacterium]